MNFDKMEPPQKQVMDQVLNSLKTDGFVRCFAQKEISQFALYLAYRVQYALFEIQKDTKDAMSWDEFVLCMRQSQDLRNAARAVALHAVQHFDVLSFDFNAAERVCYFEEDDGEDWIQMAELFPDQVGEGLVELLMLKAEIVLYEVMFCIKGHDYTWKQYLEELQKSEALFQAFSHAFHTRTS